MLITTAFLKKSIKFKGLGVFIHDDCNKKLADNCLKRIEFYREHKNNDIYDDFITST